MKQKHPNGIAGLIILAAVAIIMILYLIQLKTFFPDSASRQGSSPKPDRPWLDEDLIIPEDHLIDMPKHPKPDIAEGFTIEARVKLKGEDRGSAVIKFAAKGKVTGLWKCSYKHESRLYSYDAAFAGNIVSDKVYKDDAGNKDKSKLFFISKGRYTQKMIYTETGETSKSEGTVYVSGWLDASYTATGFVTIKQDDWSASYDFKGTYLNQ